MFLIYHDFKILNPTRPRRLVKYFILLLKKMLIILQVIFLIFRRHVFIFNSWRRKLVEQKLMNFIFFKRKVIFIHNSSTRTLSTSGTVLSVWPRIPQVHPRAEYLYSWYWQCSIQSWGISSEALANVESSFRCYYSQIHSVGTLIIVENGICNLSPYPGRGCLRFASH